MSKVYTGASMSLDGYISGPGESGFEHLFKWYGNGDVEVPTANPDIPIKTTQVSADHIGTTREMTGALVVGRKLFDFTDGWSGKHPWGVPVVVLSHSVPDGWPRDDAPFTFVSEGIERAIEVAAGLAGDKGVGLNGGTIASQALNAGLLDEVWVDLAPGAARRRDAVLRGPRRGAGRAGGAGLDRREPRHHPHALPGEALGDGGRRGRDVD